MKKYKTDIIFFSVLTVIVVACSFIAEQILPFILGLICVFAVWPLVEKIRKFIRNQYIATTVFLLLSICIVGGAIWIFASQIVNDVSRFNNAIKTYATDNSEALNETTETIKTYIEGIYSPDELKAQLGLESTDSLSFDTLAENMDTDKLSETWSSISSLLFSDEDKNDSTESLNWYVILFSGIGYFIYILYTYPYFEGKFKKYFSGQKSGLLQTVIDDFKHTFLSYFRQRGKIVLIFTVIFVTTFYLIGIPGALLFGIVTGILCFVSYLQYIMLIPLALFTLVLAMEQNGNFLIYYGIIVLVFILVSVLEEVVLFPKIMKDVSSMNPAIMMLALAVWSYLMGVFGLLIALPLTSVILSYADRFLLYEKEVRERQKED